MKPVIVQQGSLTTTDTFSTFSPIVCPIDVLTPIRMNKLSGFLGFKADSVFRIQINATPFQQGRYMLTSTVTAGVDTSQTFGALYVSAHTNTLIQRTQLPRVELDINCDTEGILRVPYVSCYNYYPLRSKTTSDPIGNYASVRLFPYSALRAVTGVTCGFTIWHHFENISLYGAAVPQSGRVSRGTKSIQKKEQDSLGVGPVQSVLLKVKSTMGHFAKIPLLSAYAQPLEWAADIGACAANVFGWSKPINMGPSMKTYRRLMGDHCLTDTVDDSNVLALTQKNSVAVAPGFAGTDVDEMDFNYIATIPAFKSRHSWDTSMPVGSLICDHLVSPYIDINQRTISGTVFNNYLPIEFVSEYFGMWRGSMTYTFKLPRTIFHSGRIIIAFFPWTDRLSSPGYSAAMSEYVHREIVDVREMNEITVTIPYIANTPYLSVRRDNYRSIGVLALYVLDVLVAPPTVSSSIDILMEKCAGPDFEVAFPLSRSLQPSLGIVPESGFDPNPTRDDCQVYSGMIGTSEPPVVSTYNSEICIGEKIMSFRSLLQSCNFIFSKDPLPELRQCLNIFPYYANKMLVTESVQESYQTSDLFSTLHGVYALARGGVRIKALYDREPFNNIPPIVAMVNRGETVPFAEGISRAWAYGANGAGLPHPTQSTTAGSTANYMLGGPVHIPHVLLNNSLEIRTPQYSSIHSRACGDCFDDFGLWDNMQIVVSSMDASNQTVAVARAAAEDTNFGNFVSIMPMQVGFNGRGPF